MDIWDAQHKQKKVKYFLIVHKKVKIRKNRVNLSSFRVPATPTDHFSEVLSNIRCEYILPNQYC